MLEHIGIAGVAIVLLVIAVLLFKRRSAGSAQPTKKRSSRHDNGPANTQLYVGNVSYRAEEDELFDFFSQFGEVETARIIKDRRTGRSKGFAFVTYYELESASAALAAHGQELGGRALIVRYAKPAAR